MTENQVKPNFRHYDPRDCERCREGNHRACEYLAALEDAEPLPPDGEEFFSGWRPSLGTPGLWCGCFNRDEDVHYGYEQKEPQVTIMDDLNRPKYGDIEISVSWEVTFLPFKSCLDRVGFEPMMNEIEIFLCDSKNPTWRDDVQLVGNFDREFRFALDTHGRSTFAPDTMEAFQDWVAKSMAEIGYEGWTSVGRIVTIMSDSSVEGGDGG